MKRLKAHETFKRPPDKSNRETFNRTEKRYHNNVDYLLAYCYSSLIIITLVINLYYPEFFQKNLAKKN